MIRYSLRCADDGHVFEQWFDNYAHYEAQSAEGALACPSCGSAKVSKMLAAPALGASTVTHRPAPAPACASGGCAAPAAGACPAMAD
ncbi:DUF1178 family protein [Caenispirillum salinarum]|uniref:DUF1178 family protein n=1 Tax=Caenispirillum salinarum TaxID=859058 RepID=UPI00384FB705